MLEVGYERPATSHTDDLLYIVAVGGMGTVEGKRQRSECLLQDNYCKKWLMAQKVLQSLISIYYWAQ